MSRQVDTFAHSLFYRSRESLREFAFLADQAISSLIDLLNIIHETKNFPDDYQGRLAIINQAVADYEIAKGRCVDV